MDSRQVITKAREQAMGKAVKSFTPALTDITISDTSNTPNLAGANTWPESVSKQWEHADPPVRALSTQTKSTHSNHAQSRTDKSSTEYQPEPRKAPYRHVASSGSAPNSYGWPNTHNRNTNARNRTLLADLAQRG